MEGFVEPSLLPIRGVTLGARNNAAICENVNQVKVQEEKQRNMQA